MATMDLLLLSVVAGLASLFMAWTIGAGSSGSTPFAPAVGARAIPVMRAAFLVGILAFAGAIVQGLSVAEAMAEGMIRGVSLSPTAVVIGLVVAASLVAVGVFTGYPIATAFTATGAVIGVGLALGGAPAWETYGQVGLLWVLTPFVGGGAAYFVARVLRDDRVPEPVAIPVLAAIVSAIVVNVPFTFLGSSPEGASIAAVLATGLLGTGTGSPADGGAIGVAVVSIVFAGVFALALAGDVRRDVTGGQQHFLLALGGLVAFSAGGSQVGLAIGPILPLYTSLAIPAFAILVGGGIGMLLGCWMGASRMIKAISQDYSALGPRRAIAALVPAFAIAQIAILFGLPVSFNEIVISAVVGSGFAAGEGGISRGKALYTVAAWTGSLLLSIVVAYGALSVVLSVV